MGLFCIHPFRDETKTSPHPEDMGVNGKGLPSQAKEKKAVNRFGTNPFEDPKGFLDLFGTHPFQEDEAQLPFPCFNPSEEVNDPSRLLSGQSTRPDGLNEGWHLCLEKIFPTGESGLQSLVGPIPIFIIGILGEYSLNEDIEKIGPPLPPGNAVFRFQKMMNLA
jgi:hypothetical protein